MEDKGGRGPQVGVLRMRRQHSNRWLIRAKCWPAKDLGSLVAALYEGFYAKKLESSYSDELKACPKLIFYHRWKCRNGW
ncbi:hypothetical protein Nepgr_019012 [Nepenthes gracilis]|uniref:Uncharacterized protein n=1 Tax=Nepenthes gracilis TaxID=150966 RepID=A0AAD3SUJ6_NEPGR|nr:hypothetical protein Nepgr_019012 [Nepenthes gracilis]